MTIIPKGETHGWAFAKFGEEDGDRLVVSEDIVVIPKKDYDKAQEILSEMRKGPPPGDETPASVACLTFADRLDKALSGNDADSPVDGMTFGQAIDACRYRGAKIQRANWNGEGQFVRFEEVLASEDGKLHTDPQGAPGMISSSCFVFHFVNRRTGETGIQVGWLASQADMYASDWRIVE